MDGYVGFHAALRHAYSRFISEIAKQCKKLVQHHIDSVTSAYSEVCYDDEFQTGFGSVASFTKFNHSSSSSLFLELSDNVAAPSMINQENIPPEKHNQQQITPGKSGDGAEALRESQITIPETPSPDQPCEMVYKGVKKEHGNGVECGPRKRVARIAGSIRQAEYVKVPYGASLFGNGESGSKSAYGEICSSAAQHFARIRDVLVERCVTSTLNSGFLTPW